MRNYRVTIITVNGVEQGIIVKASSEKAVRDRLSKNKSIREIVKISS